MTTAADILKAHGVRTRLFLRIDGVEEILWQDDGTGSPPSWDTSGKVCLLPPTEISMGLDVTTFKAEASAQTFQFIDIKDTDGKSWWGKKLGTSAWDAAGNDEWRINVGAAPQTYVDCNAVNIPLKDNREATIAGTYYLGQETISVINAASNVLQGVKKGLYSSIYSDDRAAYTFGQTYLRPEATSGQYQMAVGEVPFTFHGRRASLYMATYDTASSSWNNPGIPYQVWADTFSDASIGADWSQDPNNGTIAEAGGAMVVEGPGGAIQTFWQDGAANKTAPKVYAAMSDVRTESAALFCAESKFTITDGGNNDYGLFGLMQDDDNAWMVSAQCSTGRCGKRTLVADSYSQSAVAGASVLTVIARVYWNTHATLSFTIEDNDVTLAPNQIIMYYSHDAGTTFTKVEAASTLAISPDYVVLSTATSPAGAAAHGVDFDYVTITQTIESGTELLWTGRVSNTIQYKPNPSKEEGHWKLGCESIMADVDRKICNNMYTTDLKGINLTGHAFGREFWVEYTPKTATGGTDKDKFVFPAAWYKDADAVVAAYDKPGNAIELTVPSGKAFGMYIVWNVWKSRFVMGVLSPHAKGKLDVHCSKEGNSNDICHPLRALGFTKSVYTVPIVDLGSGTYFGGNALADEAPAEAYHPCQSIHNGNKLYVEDAEGFWPDQGDDLTAAGYVKVPEVTEQRDEFSYWARYTSRSGDALTLSWPSSNAPGYIQSDYVVHRMGDDSVEVKQIYFPVYEKTNGVRRGIFESHLAAMVSTGTPGYNGTYDIMAKDIGVAIQSDIVDAQSFLDADKDISSNPLTERFFYQIEKPISFYDLLTRDCMLHGYAMTWNRGKLRLKDIIYPNKAGATVTLDDSNCASRDEKLLTDIPSSTVVNQYKCTIGREGKEREITISDADSVNMLGANSIDIKHPGVPDTLSVVVALTAELIGRPYRFPSPVIERTLSPVLLNRVYPGDLVLLTSGDIPDPDGGGAFNTTVYALVLDSSWNHRAKVGSSRLLLMTQMSAYGNPWAPAAMVTAHAAGVITLAAHTYGDSTKDPEDGTAFGATDHVDIFERSSIVEGEPVPRWTNQTINDAYGTAGARQFTLAASLAGYDATKQYVMTFTDYGDTTTSQKGRGIWQAHLTTELLTADTKALRYG